MNVPNPDRVFVSGLPISRASHEQHVRLLLSWLEEDTFRRVATVNLDFLRLAARDEALQQSLETADLACADGAPLLWLADRQGLPIDGRTTGADLIPDLLRRLPVQTRVAVVGGTAEVARRFSSWCAAENHDGIRCLHVTDRVDMDDEEACLALERRLRAFRPHLLLAALGCPRQEAFLERHGKAIGARVGIGIGGTIDMLVGERRRAPSWVGRMGLEWLVRFAQEPRRLGPRYLADAQFLARLLRAGGRTRPA